ncbi:RecX family transcriptional regulator [Jiella sp. MQZ9-1]|uniref:Regulatory protein RecX n=1 Tax=Jiella flava TaxID=2816857 RepID=A0A939FWU5_9HYPH|nr:RecX family transcriptional regulator [Jiella flava]MBO0661630.1 RecX family transcriptional regulator [Jiella flava]MCD2470272.1 RecX family transcriptional regulator [Jiella flava]
MAERGAKSKFQPKPVTEDWLRRSAFHYLERYAASGEGLRRVLRRRAARRVGGVDALPNDLDTMIDGLLERFAELKLIDDRAFAEARLASLRRKGTSRSMAAARLGEKGVGRALVQAVLDEDETTEAAAAATYAKRRRFGPHRRSGRDDRRDKEIASMLRAGFPMRLAIAAIDGEISSNDMDLSEGD